MKRKNKTQTNDQKPEAMNPEASQQEPMTKERIFSPLPLDKPAIVVIRELIARLDYSIQQNLKWQKAYDREKADADQMEEMIKMMTKNVQMMQNNILEAQEVNQKLYKTNVELGKQNEDFLKDRNDVIRKYNLYIQFQKMIPEEELKAWTQKLPENSKNKFHFNAKDYEMTSEVLESGNVKYVISKIKKELPSGKEVELVDVIDKEKH
jgi:hypothetical protein